MFPATYIIYITSLFYPLKLYNKLFSNIIIRHINTEGSISRVPTTLVPQLNTKRPRNGYKLRYLRKILALWWSVNRILAGDLQALCAHLIDVYCIVARFIVYISFALRNLLSGAL